MQNSLDEKALAAVENSGERGKVKCRPTGIYTHCLAYCTYSGFHVAMDFGNAPDPPAPLPPCPPAPKILSPSHR
jgi:hypothetical protein